MAEILLFHHAHGLTEGLTSFAERLRANGHVVHTPDAYAGLIFDRLDEGIQHAQDIGHDALADVARRAAREHRHASIVIGFSLGAAQAQLLAQDLPRIRGCLLMGGALPPLALGGDWRHQVPLQVHLADPDEWVDEQALGALTFRAPHARVFRYPGQRHMFVDRSLRDYDADAADLFEQRVEEWLDAVGQPLDHSAAARVL
ncbi:dienelactone hydrolase family protein [Demequina zhanjiangensis]|uniref:Alpha/beta fold hydrolase n=1 Tax=Demequina zhanjiangensis TaxID=3051659 RepID=A0ABT8G2Y5_9MICO|nr:dienelactone hydrolase family protein [Demequina sp. SYSU T00b26]MDN4473496.1 alpha/beta fold hydrolase [Demequina sp. SYSU T00b26]